jgi:hypothetical protein
MCWVATQQIGACLSSPIRSDGDIYVRLNVQGNLVSASYLRVQLDAAALDKGFE